MKTSNKKAIILLVSFALVNVALSSIINFHFYRIFGKELTKVNCKFIKKDDNHFSIKTFENHSCKKIVVLGDDQFNSFSVLDNLKFEVITLESSKREISVFRNLISKISPTRGSPFLS